MDAHRAIARVLLVPVAWCCLLPTCDAQLLVGERLWVTDGNVRAVARGAGRLYIGGDFSYVGPVTGAAVVLDADAATPVAPPAGLTGIVDDATSDGAGGWYIARDLRTDGLDGPSLVHLLADGTLHPLALPQPDGPVYAVARSGSTLYLGGDFTIIDGQPRMRAAAVDLSSRTVLGWNPAVAGTTTGGQRGVFALVLLESAVVLAGNFNSVAGQLRRNLAAVDSLTAQPLAWNPDPDFAVLDVARSGDTLYLGGVFGRVGGVARASLAAVDGTSGALLPWNPSPTGQVYTLAVAGTTVYAGGTFNVIGGQARSGAAAIDATSGAIRAWNTGLDVNFVSALAVRDGTVYLGGGFDSVNGQTRLKLAAADATTGQALPWIAHTSEAPNVLALDGATLLVGGAFNSVGGVARNFGAALDLRTGEATAWNPDANGSITDIAFADSTVFVVGGFANIGGAQRRYAAELDAVQGIATAFNPPDIDIPPHRAVAITPTHVYVAGEFSEIGRRASGGLAELDRATGALTARDIGTEGAIGISVNALVLDAPARVLDAGGFFSQLAGAARSSIGAIDLRTGQATSWNPGARGRIRTMDDAGDALYIAGDFDDNAIYAGGSFTRVGGIFHINVAALDPVTGALLNWDPVPRGTGTFTFSGYVYDIALQGRRAILGGNFSTLLDEARSGVGIVTTLETAPAR